MSRNQRIGLLAAAVVVAVVTIVIAAASGGDDGGQGTASTRTARTSSEAPHETLATNQKFDRIRIKDGNVVGGAPGNVVGGAPNIKVTKGEHVRIVVSSDAHDDIHLHGYDIEKPVEPGQPAQFNFIADIEGIFEIESHVAEDEGRQPLVGKLTVEPG
jgi:FtsP/CotA-like multicopper oxidase with cupredoxin domain